MNAIKKMAAALCIFLLIGCQPLPDNINTDEKYDSFTSLGEEPDFSYEVPVSTPNILVNQLGYITESNKVAIFRGQEIPETFDVVNADTGNVVFSGVSEDRGYNEELQEYNSYGSFTDLNISGNYYIQAPILGRSYTFVIGEGIYDDVFEDAFKQYYYNRCGMTLTEEFAGKAAHNACHIGKGELSEDRAISFDVSGGWHQDGKASKNIAEAAENMAIMLLAYELYGGAFTDKMNIPESGNGIPDILDEIRYEIEWMLKLQDAKTGAVYNGTTTYEKDKFNPTKGERIQIEPFSQEAAKAFSMILAKFSYLYQSYDTAYATNCLKAADRAWRYVQRSKDKEMDSMWFGAAAELYRATGNYEYHTAVKSYLNLASYPEQMDDITLLGCVTYISTKQKVERNLCEDVISVIMAKAEDVSKESKQFQYLTAGNKEQDNNAQLLQNAMYLTVVDHIITNHEYQTMIENHLHYFMGRNAKAISYIDNVGANNYKSIDINLGIMNRFNADSILIFILSEVVQNHQK